ncbi:MAG: hypothetical protein ACI85I_002277 [Arenicella sp.]|jgi:hypothetical protein
MFEVKGFQEHITRQLEDVVGVLKRFSNGNLKIEERNKELDGVGADLHSVSINNIPKENIWIFDNEFYQNKTNKENKILTSQKGAFSSAGKKVELTVIYEKDNYLYLILIEMKTSMNSKKYSEVIDKMESSLSTISVFLSAHPHFSQLDNKHLYPIGICCYNYLLDEATNSKYIISGGNRSTFKSNFLDKNWMEFIASIEPIALNSMSIPFLLFNNKNEPKTNAFDIDFKQIFERLELLMERKPLPPKKRF